MRQGGWFVRVGLDSGLRSWCSVEAGGFEFYGVCQPGAEWRRRRLREPSMYSDIALASSTRVFHRCRLSSSVWMRPQNDSATALS